MRVLQTALCVATALCLKVACHPTLVETGSMPEVPDLVDTRDDLYNPHANHDNPALVPRVEPGKATTPDTTKPPAAPPLEKKIPPLPQRAAFPPKDGPISCPIKAGAAPAAGTPPTKNPGVTKRTPAQDEAALLKKNELFVKALKAETDLITEINKVIDAIEQLQKEADQAKLGWKKWTNKQFTKNSDQQWEFTKTVKSKKRPYIGLHSDRVKASSIVVSSICIVGKSSKDPKVTAITRSLEYYKALAVPYSKDPDAPEPKTPLY